MNLRWLTIVLLVISSPASADEETAALARIEALTDEQMFTVFVEWVTENSVDCRFTIDHRADNTDLKDEILRRLALLAEISDDLRTALDPQLFEKARDVDGEALAESYFLDVVTTDQSRTFILPDCTVGLS